MSYFELNLSPLYRRSAGFNPLMPMVRHSLKPEPTASNYPHYNIEVIDDNQFAITLAVAGFSKEELDLEVEKNVLTVTGKKEGESNDRRYLYQSIASGGFERKFNLAEHVQVKSADLADGLLRISLVREIPEAMKPRRINVSANGSSIQETPKDAA